MEGRSRDRPMQSRGLTSQPTAFRQGGHVTADVRQRMVENAELVPSMEGRSRDRPMVEIWTTSFLKATDLQWRGGHVTARCNVSKGQAVP